MLNKEIDIHYVLCISHAVGVKKEEEDMWLIFFHQLDGRYKNDNWLDFNCIKFYIKFRQYIFF